MKLVQLKSGPRLPQRGAVRRILPRALPFEELANALNSMGAGPEALEHFLHSAPLGLEMVVPQCKAVNCGDLVYRATLPNEAKEFDPKVLGFLVAALWYLNLRPGVLAGFIDTYFKTPYLRATERVYVKEDFKVTRKLASGAFGEVSKGELADAATGRSTQVILKKAKEFGEAEVWMNERCMRACPNAVAEYITAFDETGRIGDPLWLVWKYEGDNTLYDLMQKRDFPYNAEPLLFGKELPLDKGPRRRLVVYKTLMRQLLECLDDLHKNGLIHRDIKPQNMILSQEANKIKLIDLGACADLRVGINYVPSEYLMDPRFAPPQQYIMSTTTPRAPPAPLAALLSPVLFQLNKPDRFDLYSAGIVLLQLAFPKYRNDDNLIAFNKRLGELKYDLRRWRYSKEVQERLSKDASLREGFEVLDLEGGAGWDLLCALVQYEPFNRPSSAEAKLHPFCLPPPSAGTSLAEATGTVLAKASKITQQVTSQAATEWLSNPSYSGLTEAQLENELTEAYEPEVRRHGSQTMAFWRERQADLDRKLKERRKQLTGVIAPVAQTIRGGGGGVGGKRRAEAPVGRGGNGNGAAPKLNLTPKNAAPSARASPPPAKKNLNSDGDFMSDFSDIFDNRPGKENGNGAAKKTPMKVKLPWQ